MASGKDVDSFLWGSWRGVELALSFKSVSNASAARLIFVKVTGLLICKIMAVRSKPL